MIKYRIVERTWSSDKKDYAVQEYSKKWYSKKYKWRTLKYKFYYGDGMCCSKEPAIFSSKAEAEIFLKEHTNHLIKEKVIEEYEIIYSKNDGR